MALSDPALTDIFIRLRKSLKDTRILRHEKEKSPEQLAIEHNFEETCIELFGPDGRGLLGTSWVTMGTGKTFTVFGSAILRGCMRVLDHACVYNRFSVFLKGHMFKETLQTVSPYSAVGDEYEDQEYGGSYIVTETLENGVVLRDSEDPDGIPLATAHLAFHTDKWKKIVRKTCWDHLLTSEDFLS